MKLVYSITSTPFYTGRTAPESSFDDRYEAGKIPEGIFYIDITNHNVYVISNSEWTLVTDSTLLSSFVSSTSVITSNLINSFGAFKTIRVNKSTYYTSTHTDLTSVILPQTFGNSGAWFALEDSLGYGFNVCVDSTKGLKVIERVGGISGVSSKHYFFCDGNKWYLAKSFLPPSGPTTFAPNYIYVDGNNGSNTTGVKYDSSKPYKTITQALFVAISDDIIYVKAGVYIDYNMSFKNGVSLHLEKGVIIQPTANGGNVKIFGLTTSGSNGRFTITGNGKLINPFGNAQSGTPSIENGLGWSISITCDEISSIANWNSTPNACFDVNNAKVTSEIYARWGKMAFNNCTIIDVKTTTFNIDWGVSELIYNNCTFIRKQASIPWNVNFPSSITGQGDQGLDNYKFGTANGSGTSTRTTAFINCIFINNVGGNGISFKEYAWNDATDYNPTLIISGCKFMLSDNTKNCVLADGSGGVPVSAGFYFDNNISNSALGTINSGTLINKLSGTGFQIASKYKLPSPYPTI